MGNAVQEKLAKLDDIDKDLIKVCPHQAYY
jgi:hypothetical protein